MRDTTTRVPSPALLQLMEEVVADLDRIGREHGREARAAAITDVLARLGAGGRRAQREPSSEYVQMKAWHPRRRRRGRYFYGFMPDGSRCPHRHQTMAAAEECSRRAHRAIT